MKLSFSRWFAALGCAAGLALWTGCPQTPQPVAPSSTTTSADDHDHDHDGHDHDADGHDHADHDHDGEKAAAEESAATPDAEPDVVVVEEAMEEEIVPVDPAPAPESTDPAPAPDAPTADAEIEKPAVAGERNLTGDWHMWGGAPSRNMVNASTGLNFDFEPGIEKGEGKNMVFVSNLGSQTYGNPTVASGKVLVGTNNGGEYRPKHKGDRGVILCFDDQTGEFLWQLTREKLPEGRVSDWPEQGICSTPFIDGDRMWVVTNRAELMCLDLEGFHDNENDGLSDEVDSEPQDADIIWKLDLIQDLGVFVHNLATSSPLIHGDTVYIVTSNGVDEGHIEIPSPRAPSFIAVNKNTGEVLWEQNYPFDQILHGQWSSPALGDVNGQVQIYFPGGNGWLYALDPMTGEVIWKFDANPKDAVYELGGRGTRNELIATPVFYENCVYIGVGQDPEHGEGIGHYYRIDATKMPANEEKDASPQIAGANEGEWVDNPDSAQVWHYGGEDEDGALTGKKGSDVFRRTMSTASVTPEFVYVADLSGRIHCIDREKGTRIWEGDLLSGIWGSTMAVDGKLLLGDENGDLHIMNQGREFDKKHTRIPFESSIYTTPTVANGKLYISDRSRLYCFDVSGQNAAPAEAATGAEAPSASE